MKGGPLTGRNVFAVSFLGRERCAEGSDAEESQHYFCREWAGTALETIAEGVVVPVDEIELTRPAGPTASRRGSSRPSRQTRDRC